MARVITLALFALASAWGAGARLTAQAVPVPPGIQVRDPSAPPPQRGQGPPPVRRIAIGSGAISGTVVAADSGRPVRNARVNLNGFTPPPIPAASGAPSTATLTPPVFAGGVTISSSLGGVSQTFNIGSLSRTALTDAQGQFVFSRLAVGQYSLSVNRNEYLTTNYGQKKPGGSGTTIQLADGQQMKVELRMIRGGVITGQVIGEDGEPVSNAQVRSLRYTIASGVRRLQSSGFAQSDDRGMYRMFGLQPGDYIVSATPNPPDFGMDRMNADMAAIEQAIASGAVQPAAAPGMPATVIIPTPVGPQAPPTQPPGYLPVYYPSTPIPSSASVVHVAGGDEHTGVDVQIQLVQASTIQGSISNPPPQGIAVQVSLLSDDPTTDVGSLPSTRVGNDGKFTFRTIAPGKYIVFAQTVASPQPMQIVNGQPIPGQVTPGRLDDSQRWWARAPVTVEGQATLTTPLTLQAGRSISGVVLFEMAKPPDLTQARLTVSVTPPPGSQNISFGPPSQAPVGSDGRFTLNGVIPGKYILRSQSGGLAKSSIVNGEDTLDFPLDFTGERDISDAVLTVTDKTNGLSGTLTDSLGKPGTDYTIVLASSDERFWTPSSRRVVISRTSTDGRYQFRNLPPGSYLLAAVTELENGAQYDPQFLRSLNGAGLRVTVAEGAQQTQDLRIGR
jgi:protocatechuate 3,4-dioxygenase beta subunit